MYRISKVLNHNAIIAVKEGEVKELLLMANGIGFGKKVAERIDITEDTAIYSLEKNTKRGESKDLAKSIDPVCLEIANTVLEVAKQRYDQVDSYILFPLADHIDFAIKRIRNNETISNPLTEDIKHLFPGEFQVALSIVPLIKKHANLDVNEDEVGYVALHVHSAVAREEISTAMMATRGVKLCLEMLEERLDREFDINSTAYNRLINHVRFMIIRGVNQEEIKLNMNEYMKLHAPDDYEIAKEICSELGKALKISFLDAEIGYFAMHLQRALEG